MTAPPMRVVLADDAHFIREAVGALLRERGIDVVAQAEDAAGLRAAVADTRPDVAVIDIRMPPGQRVEGLEAAVEIRRSHPDVGVMLLSQYLETHHLRRLLGDRPRGVGYLLKERIAGASAFLDRLRDVARGGCAIDPEIVALMMDRRTRSLEVLTPRERQVLALIAEGLTNQAICDRLFLARKTVETHVRNIFIRLGLEDDGDHDRRVVLVLIHLGIHHPPPSPGIKGRP